MWQYLVGKRLAKGKNLVRLMTKRLKYIFHMYVKYVYRHTNIEKCEPKESWNNNIYIWWNRIKGKNHEGQSGMCVFISATIEREDIVITKLNSPSSIILKYTKWRLYKTMGRKELSQTVVDSNFKTALSNWPSRLKTSKGVKDLNETLRWESKRHVWNSIPTKK